MKLPVLICLATALCATAQEKAPVDLEARRESVVTLRQHLEMRKQRLAEVATEIREGGRKIDARIETFVKMLSGLKDSQDSKRRVSQIKGEAIGGLKRMILTYKTERRTIVERLRTGDAGSSDDALSKDMQVIDQLVEKRAADIVVLVKSMPAGEDVAKYEPAGGSYYDGYYEEETRISEAWRQNRRDKVQTDKQRREVREALEKAISDLDGRKRGLASAISAGNITGAEKEIQGQELAHVESLLEQRKAQLIEISTPSAAPEQSASDNEADDLKSLFEDARRDIATEFSKTLRLYHSAANERDKINEIQTNLEAREKWLSENDPAAKKAE